MITLSLNKFNIYWVKVILKRKVTHFLWHPSLSLPSDWGKTPFPTEVKTYFYRSLSIVSNKCLELGMSVLMDLIKEEI